jgi:hypothetical protein
MWSEEIRVVVGNTIYPCWDNKYNTAKIRSRPGILSDQRKQALLKPWLGQKKSFPSRLRARKRS